MKTRSLPILFALALTTATSACTANAASGSAATGGETKTSARKPNAPVAKAPAPAPDAGSQPAAGSPAKGDDDDSVGGPAMIIGMTRAQVRARLGAPTETRGNDWIYTPAQEGCRDVILSDVVTFKNGVVAGVRKQRRQTGKICSGRWR